MSPARASDAPSFEGRSPRPIVKTHCFHCHGGRTGASRGSSTCGWPAEAIRGGESGEAIVPGQHVESLLWGAGRGGRDASRGRRSSRHREKATLTAWIERGRARRHKPEPDLGSAGFPVFTKEERILVVSAHSTARRSPRWGIRTWSGPRSMPSSWPPSRLPRGRKTFSPEADRRTPDPPGLVRPARPAADARGGRCVHRSTERPPDAYERLVDRLLDSPTMASARRGTGSTWPAMPTATATPHQHNTVPTLRL